MYHPDPNAFAEIAYLFPDGKVWRAVVHKHPDGWELRFGRTMGDTGTFMPAGTFQHSKALVKFIKSKVADRAGDVKPVYDSLHKLDGKTAQSVVPHCYESLVDVSMKSGGRGLPDCGGCPFRTQCGEPSAQPEIIPEEKCEETDEVFRHRLAQKMKDKFGTEPKKIEKAAAKLVFPHESKLDVTWDNIETDMWGAKK